MDQSTLTGIQIAPGLAIGKAFIYQDILQRDFEFYDIERHQVSQEHERIKQAIEQVRQDLQLSATRIEQNFDSELADIFRAQEAILEDISLARELLGELEQELVNAEQITRRVLRRWERRFREMEDVILRQRADDIADLSRRLLRALQGIHAHTLEKMPMNSVLVAKRLLPSDTIFLSRQSTVAVVVEFGGPGSHAALLTRALGIPAVGHIDNILQQIQTDDTLLVNGNDGVIIINPDAETQTAFRQQIDRYHHYVVQARSYCHEPAYTKDGVGIEVMANVTCREDVEQARKYGADGIGLYRIESVYLGRKILPSEGELLKIIRQTVLPLQNTSITIRLLDAGGDKPLPSLTLPHEENPFLGRRGVRLLLAYPELLTTQLKAILQLGQQFDIRILVPMVTFADDMRFIREGLQKTAVELKVTTLPLLGAMIETPAAALCVEELRQYADFFSIGTNDLTQYTMAAGRENPLVSDYFQEDHPALFKLLSLTVGQVGDTTVSVCGELAGDVNALPQLLQLGIRHISVPAPLIPLVKERIRGIRINMPEVPS
jgi:phosphotransferase system enzyme I (PtsI)